MLIFTILLSVISVFFAVFFFLQKQLQNKDFQVIKNDKQKLEQENSNLNSIVDKLKNEKQQLEIQYSKIQGEFAILKENQQKQEDFFKEQQENQKNIFQNLSNTTLEKQTEDNKKKFNEVIEPLNKEIEQYRIEISKMIEGTKNLGQSAEELAKAFRGENKIQGNWGEKQVEELLNNSGLEGLYEKQYTFNYKGTIYRPDFIIKLPDGKRFILDSKVSTENYIKYFNSTDEKEKENQIKLHINSIKKHIDELKKYQDSYKEYIKTIQEEQLETLDFIVMFIAPENAYVEAVLHSKQEILKYAYDNKVAIVTASSLMPVLRMISHLWNIEKSNKNISEIVDKVVLLHDKLSKFAKKTNETHKHLMDAVKTHEEATNYLANGNDNVLKTAERIKTLMGNKITTNMSLFIEENKTDNDTE